MDKRKSCSYLVFLLSIWVSCPHFAYALRYVSEPLDSTLRMKGNNELKITLGCAVERGEQRGKDLTISWNRDGVKLNQSTNGIKITTTQGNRSSIVISIAGPLASDIVDNYYQCEAVSSESETVSTVVLSRPARIRILGPPVFLEHPEDLTSTLGQTARFACLIDKSDDEVKPPTWYKNDAKLSIDNSRMTILPSGSLEIQNVREGDAGAYKCQVDLGTGFSRSGRLYILQNSEKDSAPPVFTAVPKSRTVLAGTDIVLECSAVAHPKQPRILWLKEGGAIDFNESDSRFSIIGEANLHIRAVTPADKGTYQCRAENKEDSIDVQATIDVVIPPLKTSDQIVNYYAYEKDDVELNCGVSGIPTPQLKWLRNGEQILHGDYFQHPPGSTRLRILGLVSSDTGFYQCFGTNAGGTEQQTMHLRVLRPGQEKPPTQLGPPTNFTTTSVTSDSISLKWGPPFVVEAVPVLGYTIYYKKLPDSPRERTMNLTKSAKNPVPPTEATIDRLQPNTTYIFRVQAYAPSGPGVHSSEITVRTVGEDPIIVEDFIAIPTSSSSVQVRWSTTSDSVQRWVIFYQEVNGGIFGNDDGRGETLTVNIPQAEIDSLKPFTMYKIKVHAVSRNGPGPEEALNVRTLSDIPADFPHNFTVEPNSASSLRLSWLPPPIEFQNGQITGYKVKHKAKGRKRAETVTTDANTLALIIPDLEKSTEYQIRIAAMNVNGTGPFTDWLSALTFAKDLDEGQVPDRPEGMQARPGVTSITITWTPARSRDGNDILVRGYTIGWGKGIPDVHTKLVASQQRSFRIDGLRPNSEYVISLRAYNRVGDGIPIYENVRSLEEDDDDFNNENINYIPPPVGLRAITSSPTSISLYWTDNGGYMFRKELGKIYYIVRYKPVDTDNKFSHVNTTDTSYMVENLRPGTTYEFSVSVVAGQKRSQWSLVAGNTTANSRPPPADLTLVGFTDSQAGQSSVVLNWQPPPSTISHHHDASLSTEDTLQSYIIYYTTTQKEWVEESVPDDVLTHKITGLTPDTNYHFRMSGKWRRSGLGQTTETKSVKTPKALTYYQTVANNPPNPIQRPNQIVLYILIGLSVLFALASVALCIYYKRKARDLENNAMGIKKDKKMKKHDPEMMKMTASGKLNPPDLWIHHDQMELKQMQQHQTLLSSSSNEFDLIDDHRTTHSLDKRALRASRRVVTTDDDDLETGSSTLRRINQKNKHSGSCSSVTVPLSLSSNASSQHNLTHNHGGQYSATSDYGTAQSTNNLSTLTRRSGANASGNLKSFGVPPPAPVISFPPGVGVVTNKSTPHVTDTRSNPVKLQNPPSVHNYFVQSDEPSSPQLQKCYSTEELNQEINNLEGLMKDLVDITAKEFQC
ncbi:unnamed protein product [Orchesella dallaii]|uniref:Neogenin n=1 Tax=Orchesella dallaii TaxID=48710 RepID=A0ABP1S069_9HEXA